MRAPTGTAQASKLVHCAEYMIDVKQAVKIAAEYFTGVMGEKAFDLTLEEVELSEDEKWWRVTLSAEIPISPPPSDLPGANALSIFRREYRRVYKLFVINAQTGAVRSMKMRQADEPATV